MTRAFADSLGMVRPYGAIFGQPKPGSPAAQAGIEAGDVITAINGQTLARSRDYNQAGAWLRPLSHHIPQWPVDGNQVDARILQLQAPIGCASEQQIWRLTYALQAFLGRYRRTAKS